MKVQIRTIEGTDQEIINTIPRNEINKNILICGTSGAGKSELLRQIEEEFKIQLKIIFKEDKEKCFNIYKIRPYLEKDRVNFIDSWKEQKNNDINGYMLIQEQIYIEELKEENQDLKNLKIKIKQLKDKVEKIDKPIINMIENKLKHFYPGEVIKELSHKKISMENLTEDEYIFFSDYIIRNQYEELLNNIISIDEIHRLKPLLPGLLTRITREIRSRGGLIATTQSLSDLPGEMISNFGTIYTFQTMDKRDLEYLNLIDEKLKKDILQLEDHEFIEIRSYPKLKKLGNNIKMELRL